MYKWLYFIGSILSQEAAREHVTSKIAKFQGGGHSKISGYYVWYGTPCVQQKYPSERINKAEWPSSLSRAVGGPENSRK